MLRMLLILFATLLSSAIAADMNVVQNKLLYHGGNGGGGAAGLYPLGARLSNYWRATHDVAALTADAAIVQIAAKDTAASINSLPPDQQQVGIGLLNAFSAALTAFVKNPTPQNETAYDVALLAFQKWEFDTVQSLKATTR